MTDTGDGGEAAAPVDPTKEIIQRLSPTLRPDKRGEAERVIATFIQQKLHVGPLPAPDDLAHYEQIAPGSAERLIAMAERQAEHRQTMESSHLKWEYGLQSRGQWLAITALIAMLVLIGYTFYLGHSIAGSVLGGGTIVAIVGMFLSRDRLEQPRIEPQQPKQQGKGKRRR